MLWRSETENGSHWADISVSRSVFFMETTRMIPFPWLFQLPEATPFLGLWPLPAVTSLWPLVTSFTEMLLLPQFIYYEDFGDYIGSTQVMETLSPSQVLISLAKFLLSREVICSQAPGFLDRCGSWHCSASHKGHSRSAACAGCGLCADVWELHCPQVVVVPACPSEYLTAKFHDRFRHRLEKASV